MSKEIEPPNSVATHANVLIAEGTATQLKERLGSTVIEIAMRDDDAAARAAEVLTPIGKRSRDGKLVRINVPGGEGPKAMLEAVRILDHEHLDPASMFVREPTLDDVFLELTGHTTSDSDEGGGS